MKSALLLVIILTTSTKFNVDVFTKNQIDEMVTRIDGDSNLTITKVSYEEIYKHTPCDGGIIQVSHKKGEVSKILVESGMSYGVLIEEVYFYKQKPILIVNMESHFPFDEDQKHMDRTRLDLVYKERVYVYDWDNGVSERETEGSPEMYEPVCGLYEYGTEWEAIFNKVNNPTNR